MYPGKVTCKTHVWASTEQIYEEGIRKSTKRWNFRNYCIFLRHSLALMKCFKKCFLKVVSQPLLSLQPRYSISAIIHETWPGEIGAKKKKWQKTFSAKWNVCIMNTNPCTILMLDFQLLIVMIPQPTLSSTCHFRVICTSILRYMFVFIGIPWKGLLERRYRFQCCYVMDNDVGELNSLSHKHLKYESFEMLTSWTIDFGRFEAESSHKSFYSLRVNQQAAAGPPKSKKVKWLHQLFLFKCWF